ncbi:MAG: metal ABC transporter permease [Thermoproteota archaeon]|nr:metal ABC transporter permease [Thermoproteota archaeon]
MISLEIFGFGFMQRALIAGIAISSVCSVIGLFLVLRRQSLFGDSLAHMAFGGIAIGLFTNTYPLWTAFVASILAALGITKLRHSTNIPADSAVAIMLSSGLALGILLLSLSGGFSVDLFGFLFGNILLVSFEDTLLILVMTAVVLTSVSILYKQFLYITFDEEQAKVSGIKVMRLNYLFIVLASLTVIASMRLVGILLISSLVVIPNITAMMLGRGFRKTALISVMLSVISVISGIVLSYILNSAPSGTIVLISISIFLLTLIVKYSKKKHGGI